MIALLLVVLAQAPAARETHSVKVRVLVGDQPAPAETEVRLLNPSPLCGTAQYNSAPTKHPDANGWVSFDGVETGAGVNASNPSLGSLGTRVDGEGPFTLRFPAGLPLRGKVVDGKGRAVTTARVTLIAAGGEHELRMQAVDRKDGTFFFANVAKGKWAVLADSFDTLWSPGIEVEAGNENVEVKLPTLAWVAGRVVDTTGKPVAEPGLEVRTIGARRAPGWRQLSSPKTQAEYDAHLAPWVDPPAYEGSCAGELDGTFDCALKTARPVEVRALSWPLCAKGAWTTVKPGKQLELKVPAPAKLKLKALSSTSAPLAQVTVELRTKTSEDPTENCELSDLSLSPSEGALAFELPVAVIELTFRAQGHQPVTKKLSLKPGKELELGTIKFAAGARLVGKVLDADGKPAPFATIYLGDEYLVNAEEDGTFMADWAKPGKATVSSIEDNEFVGKQVVKLTAGVETAVVITLPKR